MFESYNKVSSPQVLRRLGARPPFLGGLSFYPFGVKTNFYIDGFNLYYGAVKGTPYKWLDSSGLFALM